MYLLQAMHRAVLRSRAFVVFSREASFEGQCGALASSEAWAHPFSCMRLPQQILHEQVAHQGHYLQRQDHYLALPNTFVRRPSLIFGRGVAIDVGRYPGPFTVFSPHVARETRIKRGVVRVCISQGGCTNASGCGRPATRHGTVLFARQEAAETSPFQESHAKTLKSFFKVYLLHLGPKTDTQ